MERKFRKGKIIRMYWEWYNGFKHRRNTYDNNNKKESEEEFKDYSEENEKIIEEKLEQMKNEVKENENKLKKIWKLVILKNYL